MQQFVKFVKFFDLKVQSVAMQSCSKKSPGTATYQGHNRENIHAIYGLPIIRTIRVIRGFLRL